MKIRRRTRLAETVGRAQVRAEKGQQNAAQQDIAFNQRRAAQLRAQAERRNR